VKNLQIEFAFGSEPRTGTTAPPALSGMALG